MVSQVSGRTLREGEDPKCLSTEERVCPRSMTLGGGREYGNRFGPASGNSGIEVVVGIEKLLYLSSLLFQFRYSLTPPPTTNLCQETIPIERKGMRMSASREIVQSDETCEIEQKEMCGFEGDRRLNSASREAE
jgi:hypothetical protein